MQSGEPDGTRYSQQTPHQRRHVQQGHPQHVHAQPKVRSVHGIAVPEDPSSISPRPIDHGVTLTGAGRLFRTTPPGYVRGVLIAPVGAARGSIILAKPDAAPGPRPVCTTEHAARIPESKSSPPNRHDVCIQPVPVR